MIKVGSDCSWCSDKILNKSDQITWKKILFSLISRLKFKMLSLKSPEKLGYFLEFLNFAFEHAEVRGLKHPKILQGRLLQIFQVRLDSVVAATNVQAVHNQDL